LLLIGGTRQLPYLYFYNFVSLYLLCVQNKFCIVGIMYPPLLVVNYLAVKSPISTPLSAI
jgi:hypothetical protein